VVHNAILTESNDPVLGRMRVMTLPIKFYDMPGTPGGPAPKAGEHTEEVLRELGASTAKGPSKEARR
jgi:crotonobetainyl-CoA:carnitine CoA-transferase CaiB-like acyl-CoA transferase